MSFNSRVFIFPASSIDSADIIITYKPINVVPFDRPISWIKILNDSNEPVSISFDGVTDHFYIPENDKTIQYLELNLNQMAQPNGSSPLFAKELQVFARGLAAGMGRIYLFALTQSNG
jgi:hypothetical protein